MFSNASFKKVFFGAALSLQLFAGACAPADETEETETTQETAAPAAGPIADSESDSSGEKRNTRCCALKAYVGGYERVIKCFSYDGPYVGQNIWCNRKGREWSSEVSSATMRSERCSTYADCTPSPF